MLIVLRYDAQKTKQNKYTPIIEAERVRAATTIAPKPPIKTNDHKSPIVIPVTCSLDFVTLANISLSLPPNTVPSGVVVS